MSLKLNNDTANGSVTLQASNTATGDVVATLPPFSTELAPRMQLMTAKIASGTSVDFTGIPSWAKKITVMFNGVSTSGTSPIQIQIGTAGGVVNTGYTSTAFTITNTAGFYANTNITAATFSNGIAIISLFGNNIWTSSSVVGSTGGNTPTSACGSVTLSGTLTQVRITTVNGTDTFDAGSVNILVEG